VIFIFRIIQNMPYFNHQLSVSGKLLFLAAVCLLGTRLPALAQSGQIRVVAYDIWRSFTLHPAVSSF
jgi:hypothetical protein